MLRSCWVHDFSNSRIQLWTDPHCILPRTVSGNAFWGNHIDDSPRIRQLSVIWHQANQSEPAKLSVWNAGSKFVEVRQWCQMWCAWTPQNIFTIFQRRLILYWWRRLIWHPRIKHVPFILPSGQINSLILWETSDQRRSGTLAVYWLLNKCPWNVARVRSALENSDS